MSTTGKKIAPGDVVMLKSGGPKMTVSYEWLPGSLNRSWHCQWFDDNINLSSGVFTEVSLLVLDS